MTTAATLTGRLLPAFSLSVLAAASATAATVTSHALARPEGSRHYLVVTPADGGTGPRPALLLLHGHGTSAAWLAGQAEFVGYRTDAWLRFADREHIGVQSALMPAKSGCAAPTRPLPVFVTHGTDDKIAPWAGGKVSHWALHDRGSGVSADESVAIWRHLAGLFGPPAVYRFPHLHKDDATFATRYVWGNAPDGLQVELLRIDGGGHTWPTRSETLPWLLRKLVGEVNHDVELTDEVWGFFKDKRRR